MVVRVRLPATALRHYLQPGPDRRVSGRVLTAPVRRDALVPAGLVLASSRDAGLVELPLQVEPGDMAQGLRPGDTVQVLAAYTDGARRGRAVVLLPTAEVVQVLQDPAGLTGTGQERGVQLRMPSDRAPARGRRHRHRPDLRRQDPRPQHRPGRRRATIQRAPGPSALPATLRTPRPAPRWWSREGADGDRGGRGGLGGGARAGLPGRTGGGPGAAPLLRPGRPARRGRRRPGRGGRRRRGHQVAGP